MGPFIPLPFKVLLPCLMVTCYSCLLKLAEGNRHIYYSIYQAIVPLITKDNYPQRSLHSNKGGCSKQCDLRKFPLKGSIFLGWAICQKFVFFKVRLLTRNGRSHLWGQVEYHLPISVGNIRSVFMPHICVLLFLLVKQPHILWSLMHSYVSGFNILLTSRKRPRAKHFFYRVRSCHNN